MMVGRNSIESEDECGQSGRPRARVRQGGLRNTNVA